MKFSKLGDELFFTSSGQLNGLYGYRIDPPNEHAHAVIAPGAILSSQVVNINDSRCSYDHSHEVLLHKTAKQIGVKQGELAPRSRCSQVK